MLEISSGKYDVETEEQKHWAEERHRYKPYPSTWHIIIYLENKRWILIRPYKSMKKLMTAWQYHLYKGRFKIEFDFRSLKMFRGLVTSLPKSVNGYLANYIHALTSFVLS